MKYPTQDKLPKLSRSFAIKKSPKVQAGRYTMTTEQYLEYQIEQLKKTHNEAVISISTQYGTSSSKGLENILERLPYE